MLHDRAAARLAPLLSQLENYERSRPDRRIWDLANARALLDPLGPKPAHGKAVQVGGSKGKGTVCAFLGALAQHADLRAGAYLSPHVTTILERILLDGRTITVDAMETQLRHVLARADRLGVKATFFEALTVAAVQAFVAAGCKLSIYEVGLGGRFDATTAIAVDASILTGVELEHTEVLGSTVAAIASEKAWIIREGGVAFTAARGEALRVVEDHAKRCGAKLFVLGTDMHLVDAIWDSRLYRARLVLPGGREAIVSLPDARGFEPQALALAAAAFAHLCPEADLQLDPAPRPWRLPCRFEVVDCDDSLPFVFDGAHTEQSLQAVAAEFQRRWPDRKAAVLFASALDKRWRQGLSTLLPIADSFVLTELTGVVGEDPQVVAEWLRAQGVEPLVIRPVAEALDAVRAKAMPRLCCGSFYLAGEARELLVSRAAR